MFSHVIFRTRLAHILRVSRTEHRQGSSPQRTAPLAPGNVTAQGMAKINRDQLNDVPFESTLTDLKVSCLAAARR